MAVNHLLSDLITRINVAQKCYYSYIYVNASSLLLNLISLFYYNGVIRGYFICPYFSNYKGREHFTTFIQKFVYQAKYYDKGNAILKIRVYLKYTHKLNKQLHIISVSTPGNRQFFNLRALSLKTNNRSRYKVMYLSTSQGILTDDMAFILRKISGEGLLQLQI